MHGADIQIKDEHGRNALDLAIQFKHTATAEYFKDLY